MRTGRLRPPLPRAARPPAACCACRLAGPSLDRPAGATFSAELRSHCLSLSLTWLPVLLLPPEPPEPPVPPAAAAGTPVCLCAGVRGQLLRPVWRLRAVCPRRAAAGLCSALAGGDAADLSLMQRCLAATGSVDVVRHWSISQIQLALGKTARPVLYSCAQHAQHMHSSVHRSSEPSDSLRPTPPACRLA